VNGTESQLQPFDLGGETVNLLGASGQLEGETAEIAVSSVDLNVNSRQLRLLCLHLIPEVRQLRLPGGQHIAEAVEFGRGWAQLSQLRLLCCQLRLAADDLGVTRSKLGANSLELCTRRRGFSLKTCYFLVTPGDPLGQTARLFVRRRLTDRILGQVKR
jgi:hypothetical protein